MVRIGKECPCPNLYATCSNLQKGVNALLDCIVKIGNSIFMVNLEVMHLAPDKDLGQPALQGVTVLRDYKGEIQVYLLHDVFDMGIGETPYTIGSDTATDAFLKKHCKWIR